MSNGTYKDSLGDKTKTTETTETDRLLKITPAPKRFVIQIL